MASNSLQESEQTLLTRSKALVRSIRANAGVSSAHHTFPEAASVKKSCQLLTFQL